MGWRRRSSAGKRTSGVDDDQGGDEHSQPLAVGACGGSGGRCRSCGVQTDAPCHGGGCVTPQLPFCGEFGYVPITPPLSPGGAGANPAPPRHRSRAKSLRPAPLDVTSTRIPRHRYSVVTPPRSLRRRRNSLGWSSPLMSPGAGSKRSKPAWALTCAVVATAAFTAGAALSSSSSASAPPRISVAGSAGVSELGPTLDGATTDSTLLPPSMDFPATSLPAASSASAELRRVGRGIGDQMRSTSSSSLFFKSIDRDGDGTVRPTELAGFVRQKIGGSAFDADDEVEAGVSNAMAAIDRDNDEGLDRNDVFAYWMKLESLLTADEVAEWVVHAVQLPESVGDIFKENVVTGYDFPELVENDGDALEKDLGIEKSSFRKKIVRHIHVRMLGIGTTPSAPPKFTHRLESCSTASLSWIKSAAKGFPVHGYRVQRRAVDLHGDGRSAAAAQQRSTANNASKTVGKDSCKANARKNGEEGSGDEQCASGASSEQSESIDESTLSSGTALFTQSASDWVTVYHGSEHDFVDTGLEYGHNYVYRVQAWNSVGRSEWTMLDMSKALRKQKCSTRPMSTRSLPGENSSAGGTFYSGNVTSWPWSFLNGSYMLANFFILFTRALLTLTAVAAAVMRFKRASAKSTLSAKEMEPAFPWLWRGINALTLRVVGMEVIPQSILGDGKAKSSYYDKEINAVGLHGYSSDDGGGGAERNEDDGGINDCARSTNRRVMFRRMKSHSTGNLAKLTSLKDAGTPTAAPKILRNKRGRISSEDAPAPSTPAPGPLAVVTTPKSSSLFRRGASRSVSNASDDNDCCDDGGGEPSPTEEAETPESAAPATPQRNLFRKEISSRTLSTREGSSTADEDTSEEEQQGLVLSDRSGSSVVAPDCYEDDHTRCNSCRKSYKFPKRFKHHCARCMSTFCHKHGRTTHSNLVSCRVPGDCVCGVCLELEVFNNSERDDRAGSSVGAKAAPSTSSTRSTSRLHMRLSKR